MVCNCMLCRYRKGLVKKSEYIEFFQKEKKEIEDRLRYFEENGSESQKSCEDFSSVDRADLEEVNESLALAYSKKRVYISGPITSNKEHYKEEFAKAKKYLEGKGCVVINPAEDDYTEEVKNAGIEDIWSHEAWLWYIKRDMDIVSNCDAIYMLLNFENSQGAIIEKATAEKVGLDIWYEAEKEKVPDCK